MGGGEFMIKYYKKELSNISEKAEIGDDCIIHSHVIIYDDVWIGKETKIQARVFIPNGVSIGTKCFIGPGVIFTNDKNPPSNGLCWEKTFVGSNVSIGAGAIILPGIIIGDNAMIGAGSVVTKNVPAGEVWVGNPAKFLKKRDKEDE